MGDNEKLKQPWSGARRGPRRPTGSGASTPPLGLPYLANPVSVEVFCQVQVLPQFLQRAGATED